MIRRFWNTLGSIKFALYLLACASFLFLAGAVCRRIEPDMFAPLNSTMLLDWIATYGREKIEYSWWFFLLIVVFALLGLNTFICTLDRMVAIVGSRRRRSLKSMAYLLSPHIMHIAFLVIILGYLALYTLGVNSYNNILKPGCRRLIPGSSITMELRDPSFSTISSRQNEFLKGLYVDAAYTIVIRDGDQTVVRKAGLNRPCLYKGYSIHVADFNPSRAKGGMGRNVWVNFTIRKNAGIPLFMTGVALFAVGVFLYVLSAVFNR